MGEIIRNLGTIQLGNTKLDVELNEGMYQGAEDVIHLQNKNLRWVCKKTEFLEIASLILVARDNLKYYKDL